MPDEPVVPPQQLPDPGRLSPNPWAKKSTVRMLTAVIAVGLLGLIGYSELRKTKPAPPPAAKPKPVQTLEAPPAALPPVVAPPPVVPPVLEPPLVAGVPPGYQEAPQKPEKTVKEQLREQREQLEAKSAFDDNLVTGPAPRDSPAPATAAPESGSAAAERAPLPDKPEESKPKKTALDFDPHQPVFILPEGTVLTCVLKNQLDGEFTGPVYAQVSMDVYQKNTRRILLPQGTQVIGEARKVSNQNQKRLAVAFHRLLIPTSEEPYSVSLDSATPGLNQIGDAALKDQVNNHYVSIFGASLAIGAIGGLAQIGNASYGGINGYDANTQFRNGVTQSMAQASERILDRFLNQMPTITIRAGHRINIALVQDLEVPAYAPVTP